MSEENSKTLTREISRIGVIAGFLTLFADGFKTIINNSRPSHLDALLFTLMTLIVELVLILPYYLISERENPNKFDWVDIELVKSVNYTKKKVWTNLILNGIIMGVSTYLSIIGFSSVDSVSGILAVKTQPISALIMGVVFLKDKINVKEVFFIFLMFLCMAFIATEGTMQLGGISGGFILLLFCPIMWNVGHSLVKPIIQLKIISIPKLIFIRMLVSTIVVGLIYVAFTDRSDFWQVTSSDHFKSMFYMGFLFTLTHLAWYKCIKELSLKLASSIVVPSPLITAILTVFITHEPLLRYHYIGIFGEIIGLYGLLYVQKQNSDDTQQ